MTIGSPTPAAAVAKQTVYNLRWLAKQSEGYQSRYYREWYLLNRKLKQTKLAKKRRQKARRRREFLIRNPEGLVPLGI
jgi:hypothetical protein